MRKNFPIIIAIVAIMGMLTFFLPDLMSEKQTSFRINYEDQSAVQKGSVIYAEYCASCHGVSLEGETADWRVKKADGSFPAPPHDETGHTWHHPDVFLFSYIRDGANLEAASNFVSAMPVYKDILTDQEIHDVLAFIKSTWPSNIRKRHDQMNRSYEESQ